ncbi:MAG: hypothetical protein ABIP94_06610 [Planctomycetota bacterium]
MLLGSRSRGRVRSPSGFSKFVRGIADLVVGQSSSRRRDPSRPLRTGLVSRWLALSGALLCFVGGFFVGGFWADAKAAERQSGAGLKAVGTAPGFIGEFDANPLSNDLFIVSVYPNTEPEAAKAKAKALSDYLRSKQLAKARPYEYATKNGPLWVVAVYYDGEPERLATRDRLVALPDDVPDATFVHLRNTEAEWPKPWVIR